MGKLRRVDVRVSRGRSWTASIRAIEPTHDRWRELGHAKIESTVRPPDVEDAFARAGGAEI